MGKTVLTSGAFDLLHYGHIHLLEEAKKLGGPNSRLVVIVARDETINRLKGKPPVIPEDQRRAVIEALKTLADCPQEALDNHKPIGEIQRLIEKYGKSCRNVIKNLKLQTLPLTITTEQVNALIQHATNYLDDGEYYTIDKKPTALVSVSYAEGILDALKLLNLVQFEW